MKTHQIYRLTVVAICINEIRTKFKHNVSHSLTRSLAQLASKLNTLRDAVCASSVSPHTNGKNKNLDWMLCTEKIHCVFIELSISYANSCTNKGFVKWFSCFSEKQENCVSTCGGYIKIRMHWPNQKSLAFKLNSKKMHRIQTLKFCALKFHWCTSGLCCFVFYSPIFFVSLLNYPLRWQKKNQTKKKLSISRVEFNFELFE